MAVGDIAEVARRLARMSYEERVAHPCIRRGRADLVVAGCAIMEAISRLWPMPRLRVADRGLREGMLLALMAADGAP
jgi:exopolyphosphatase/guanosine-5'-triphosphate,3'-diphosphate pyrophosphatase